MCSGIVGSLEPCGKTGERLRVAGFWRLAPCDTLDNTDAADFVGDEVVVRALIRRTHVGGNKLASLLEDDAICRAGECGIASIFKTDASSAFAASITQRLAPALIRYAGYSRPYR